MPPHAPDQPGRGGALPLALLVAACAVGLGAWWASRASEARELERALTPWAEGTLPAPGTPIDEALADLGARVFDARCQACHAVHGEPRLGPNLEGVTLRRDYAWFRAMVMAPDSMTREDPVARALLQGYQVQMLVAGGMDAARTRAVLEFLRRVDAGPRGGV